MVPVNNVHRFVLQPIPLVKKIVINFEQQIDQNTGHACIDKRYVERKLTSEIKQSKQQAF